VAGNLRRYNRIAPLYDLLDQAFESQYRRGRALIGAEATGITLELGAGTGKNFAYYGARIATSTDDESRTGVSTVLQVLRRHA
jgi:hypothetical protein